MRSASEPAPATSPRWLARGLVALALAAPFVGASAGARRAIVGVSTALGPALAAATRAIPAPGSSEAFDDGASPLELGDPVTILLPALPLVGDSYVEPTREGRRSPAKEPSEQAKNKAKRPRGIFVRSATVERAIRMGGRPSGSPVPASGERPAGVALSGVTRYGSALRDGDVLTAVNGTPTPSAALAVGLIAGSVRRGATAISGVVWRGQQRISVTVEIPQIKPSKRRPREAAR